MRGFHGRCWEKYQPLTSAASFTFATVIVACRVANKPPNVGGYQHHQAHCFCLKLIFYLVLHYRPSRKSKIYQDQ